MAAKRWLFYELLGVFVRPCVNVRLRPAFAGTGHDAVLGMGDGGDRQRRDCAAGAGDVCGDAARAVLAALVGNWRSLTLFFLRVCGAPISLPQKGIGVYTSQKL